MTLAFEARRSRRSVESAKFALIPSVSRSGQAVRPIRVFVVDDHQLVAEGLGMLLNGEPDMVVTGFASSVADLANLPAATPPDVVVMEFHLKDGNGLDASIAVRRVHPDVKVIFLSQDDSDVALLAAIEAGAAAFIHKSRAASDVIDAVRRVANGATLITPATVASLLRRRQAAEVTRDSLSMREREVLRLLADGMASREIARQLGISYSTVRTHIRAIDSKLGVHSKLAVVTARQLNIID